MFNRVLLEGLRAHRNWIPEIARLHFDQWGHLTGAPSHEHYVSKLEESARSEGIPSVIVASCGGVFAGSVSLAASDMSIRPSLTPWLAQLMVVARFRGQGVGAALVRAAVRQARDYGFDRLYLYTSGDLPRYYERLGWVTEERVEYLGRLRTLMKYDRLPEHPARGVCAGGEAAGPAP